MRRDEQALSETPMSTMDNVRVATRRAGAGVPTATLADVDILPELETRASRAPNYEREHRAFAELTEEMSENPRNLLQRLVEIAAELCDAHSAGISLLDGDVFRWEAVAGVFATARGGTMPRSESPCGVCIDRDATQLMYLADRCFPALAAEPRFVEALLVPFRDQVKPIGTVWVVSHDVERKFDKEDERIVRVLSQFASAICRALERAARTNDVVRLSGSAQLSGTPDGSQPHWSSGQGMRDVMHMVERVAESDVSVLLTGESGVGKEVIARELHRRSGRRLNPFVKVNCAAVPAELLETELFGHERGAFTGAQVARLGKFESANQGTILLDEIGEMPVALQAKLLHVLQDRAVTRLGSNRATSLDVRVIAATNGDLATMMRAGHFREDLYYRLQGIEIRVPPLRQRREEISGLVEFFLRRYASQYGRPVLEPSAGLREALINYEWPGNVRQLENAVRRFVILRDEALILAELQRGSLVDAVSQPTARTPVAPPTAASIDHLPVSTIKVNGDAGGSRLPQLVRTAVMAAEREAIRQALDRCHWNRRIVAQQLGVSYKTLRNKMKACGITPSAAQRSEES